MLTPSLFRGGGSSRNFLSLRVLFLFPLVALLGPLFLHLLYSSSEDSTDMGDIVAPTLNTFALLVILWYKSSSSVLMLYELLDEMFLVLFLITLVFLPGEICGVEDSGITFLGHRSGCDLLYLFLIFLSRRISSTTYLGRRSSSFHTFLNLSRLKHWSCHLSWYHWVPSPV